MPVFTAKSIAAASLLVIAAGCATNQQKSIVELGRPITLTATQTYTVRDYVSSRFHLPRAVRMHQTSASVQDDGIITVCGIADAIGQEGPGEAIGFRAYTGMFVPGREDFVVLRLASTSFEQKAVFEICRQRGAPIVIPAEMQWMIDTLR